EWIKEVLSKIPMEWPTETKIAIVKAKLDIPYQARLTWELSNRGPVIWQKFSSVMRKIISSLLSEVLRKNQIRDLRQGPGQSFASWVSTVSTVYHSIFGELPPEDVARKLVVGGAAPAYQGKLATLSTVTSIQKLTERVESWEHHGVGAHSSSLSYASSSSSSSSSLPPSSLLSTASSLSHRHLQ